MDSLNEGPGDSILGMSLEAEYAPELPDAWRGAPHISHVFSEGWLWNVHLGHRKVSADASDVSLVRPLETVERLSPGVGLDVAPAARLDIAAIAALTIWTSGGLIPQAWHGGRGVYWLAVDGSKLLGTGFDRPHIGHIHVAFTSLAGAGD
jgi:hypothetical protein